MYVAAVLKRIAVI